MQNGDAQQTKKSTSAILFLFATAKLLSKIPEACSNGSYPKCNPKDAKSNTRTNGSSECRGWVNRPWNLRFLLFPPWRTSPTKTSKFTFQASRSWRSHQWCCGKNLRSLLVGQLFGRHWMEDKWPLKKGGGLLQWYGIFPPNSQVLPPPPPPPFGQDGFST